jgi:hypothetical protein
MQPYYGIIELGEITNEPPDGEEITARFVHYPDCQQLIIWLPQYGGQGYGNIRLIDCAKNAVIDDRPVTDRLNGGIQILWDTLEVGPGNYRVEIDHPDGGKHVILFKKYKKGVQPPQKAPEGPPQPEKRNSEEPIVYRDGFGNELPNEDLILREKIFNKMAAQFGRKIEYSGTFRAGTITYVEGDLRINFYHEMGGGNCMFYVDIPNETSWEAATHTPLSRRQEILDFVAETVRREQASSTRYEIQDSAIVYYYQ